MGNMAFASLPPILQPKEEDIQMMLSAGVQNGTKNSDNMMNDYIWRRRNDGIHILHIGKTWEKLILAARIIVAIENPEDVIAIPHVLTVCVPSLNLLTTPEVIASQVDSPPVHSRIKSPNNFWNLDC